jgi:tRNA(Ile)-lysidine synthase
MNSDLTEQVAGALRQAGLASGLDWSAEQVVVGVSGGPDSAALLHALRQLLPPASLIVAHFDHGLRPGSAAEAEHVAALADGLRFRAGRADMAAQAQAARLTLEEAGRLARYDFLAGVARTEGAKAIAVGHNADDQAETILMHILRGSGTAGLRGMTVATPLPGHADLWLLRPLLETSRAQVDAYCQEHNLAVLHDPTNSDHAYLRNRLRHDLLPALESANPRLRERLREMGQIVTADEELLDELTGRAWVEVVVDATPTGVTLRRGAWRDLPLGLRRRVLRRAVAIARPAVEVSFRSLEAARAVAETGHAGARGALPEGLTLFVGYDNLLLADEAPPAAGDFPQLPAAGAITLPVPGVVELAGGWRITAAWAAAGWPAVAANPDPWTATISEAAAAGLHVRGRQVGERLRPLGLGGATKLKEIMIDRKIPARARALWPVVANNEHAVWLPGHVLDDRARVTAHDQRIVRLWCGREELYADDADFYADFR